MFNKYYQDELLYLRELGAEFARAHPAAAHFLAAPESDPDVERLLEGFAFLAARVRQKLDDELPEVTHGLIGLLWPHYLRPVPSASILEFQPVLQALRQTQTVPRGIAVQSLPVEGTPCVFRTCAEVKLQPISLDQVELESTAAGPSRLRLEFRLWNRVKPEQLDLSRIRLYLHGDPTMAFALYHALRTLVAEAVALSSEGGTTGSTIPLRVEPAGFVEEEPLLPYPARSLPGYRLLQEYFALPQKFLFVDLCGLERLSQLGIEDRFRVEVRLARALPATLRPTREDVRLHCVPVVNLFAHEADPLRLDRTKTEYRVRPSGKDPQHYEIFSVDRVCGLVPGSAEEREIPAFYSFRHDPATAGDPAYYFPRLRSSVVDGRTDTYLTFVDARGAGKLPVEETITIELTCTNRRLPEALRVGDVQVPTDSSPELVKFRNLLVPTRSVPPPLDGDLPWRLTSHLSLSYLSVTDLEALRGILRLYNFQVLHDARAARAATLRLEGIESLQAKPREVLVHGNLVRGTAVEIGLRDDRFAGDGDLFLFAEILNEFLSLHASLNSFTQLTVRQTQKGETYTWPCKIGRQTLL
jgi:type VI secretion system protein ImpG